jgi:hypothetical protein
MLNQFSSNARKLNRIIPKVNFNNLNDSLYLTASLENISASFTEPTKFQSNTRKNPFGPTVVNTNNIVISDLSGSLLNIELPSSASYESQTRSNPNPITVINNKQTITDFYNEIFEHSGRYIERKVDEFDNVLNTLTMYNVFLDYGTEGANSDNFEIFVFGLQIPGDYTLTEVNNNVVITLNDEYIDFDNVTLDDIYVIGKIVEIDLNTEDYFDLTTENDENIIL